MKYYYIDDILIIDIPDNINNSDLNIRKDVLFYDDVDFNIKFRKQRIYFKDQNHFVIQDKNNYRIIYIENDNEVLIDYDKYNKTYKIREAIRNNYGGYFSIKWYPLNNSEYALNENHAINLCYKILNEFYGIFNISEKSSINYFYQNIKSLYDSRPTF